MKTKIFIVCFAIGLIPALAILLHKEDSVYVSSEDDLFDNNVPSQENYKLPSYMQEEHEETLPVSIENKEIEEALDKATNLVDDSLLKNAFDEGFLNGKNSYLAQKNNHQYEYVSFTSKYEDLDENQKTKLAEEKQKGYVEGYHKAILEETCPCPRSY